MCWCPAAHYTWKRDKKGTNPIPCSAQGAGNGHGDAQGSCTRLSEQFCPSRCGTGAQGVLSIISQHSLCSLPWNSLWNRQGGALVSQSSLCPCTEPDEMMTMAAQLQPRGSARAFPQGRVANSFCPMCHGPLDFSGAAPPEETSQSPAEQTPLEFGCNPSTHRHHVQVSPVDRAAQGKLKA